MTYSQKSFSLQGASLNVSDKNKLSQFYEDFLGLKILSSTEKSTTLGNDTETIITLHERKDLHKAPSGDAGLYHIAIKYSSQSDLAQIVRLMLSKKPHSFSGSADHLVSEAFYFSDPEGNGIELYVDRDTAEWQWENGKIKMSSLYLDPKTYISKHTSNTSQSKMSAALGHMHIKVGEISKAKKFYVDMLGFDITAELPGALFISRDGYHHHIGLNSWESYGAGRRRESLGLHSFEFKLIDTKEFSLLTKRLLDNLQGFHESNLGIQIEDPWGNVITISN